MDAKELTEAIQPVPARAGEMVQTQVRRIEAHFYDHDVAEVLADDGTVAQPARSKGDFRHVLVELVSTDGRRFRRTASTPAKCRALWRRATAR